MSIPESLEAAQREICNIALGFPESYEESPWGERVAKVRGKVFIFTGQSDERLYLTIKLPSSGPSVLTRPYAQPAGYGLGRAGWVTLSFHDPADVPMDDIVAWLNESFRAVAPKLLLKAIARAAAPPRAPARAYAPRSPRKKATDGVAPEHRVALVGHDLLRLQRAQQALERVGVTVIECGEATPEILTRLLEKGVTVAVLDLGRQALQMLEFAHYLHSDSDGKTKLAFAGIRDTAAERSVSSSWPHAALTSRLPPGDDTFVAALANTLREPP